MKIKLCRIPLFTKSIWYITITFLLCSNFAYATSVLWINEKEKSLLANSIVLAKTIDIISQWNSEHTRIETKISLQAIESLKGTLKKGDHFFVFQPGGKVGDQAHVVAGNSIYKKDSLVLLFLININRPKKHFIETGIGVGKNDILLRNKEMFVLPQTYQGLFIFDKNGQPVTPEISSPSLEEPYSILKARILSYKK